MKLTPPHGWTAGDGIIGDVLSTWQHSATEFDDDVVVDDFVMSGRTAVMVTCNLATAARSSLLISAHT